MAAMYCFIVCNILPLAKVLKLKFYSLWVTSEQTDFHGGCDYNSIISKWRWRLTGPEASASVFPGKSAPADLTGPIPVEAKAGSVGSMVSGWPSVPCAEPMCWDSSVGHRVSSLFRPMGSRQQMQPLKHGGSAAIHRQDREERGKEK